MWHHTRLTTAGVLLGTLTHTAPETFGRAPLMPSADVYALGIVSYQLFTGELPFKARSEAMLLEEILRSVPGPIKNIATKSRIKSVAWSR
jgi:serine/threonine-protein kinase